MSCRGLLSSPPWARCSPGCGDPIRDARCRCCLHGPNHGPYGNSSWPSPWVPGSLDRGFPLGLPSPFQEVCGPACKLDSSAFYCGFDGLSPIRSWGLGCCSGVDQCLSRWRHSPGVHGCTGGVGWWNQPCSREPAPFRSCTSSLGSRGCCPADTVGPAGRNSPSQKQSASPCCYPWSEEVLASNLRAGWAAPECQRDGIPATACWRRSAPDWAKRSSYSATKTPDSRRASLGGRRSRSFGRQPGPNRPGRSFGVPASSCDRPAAEAVDSPDETNQRLGQGLGSEAPVRPPVSHVRPAKRRGQRARLLSKRRRERQGLCCSRSLSPATGRRSGCSVHHQGKCSARARSQRGPGRSIAPSQLLGEQDPNWRAQDPSAAWHDDGMGLGESFRDPKPSDAGFLREDDDLCGAMQPRWGQEQSCLASDRFGRTQLSTTGCDSAQDIHVPLQQTAFSSVGRGQHLIPERHRHVRDSTEADWHGKRLIQPSARRSRSERKGKRQTQKAKRGKGQPVSRRDPPSIAGCQPGTPEQRSQGFCKSEYTKTLKDSHSADRFAKFFNQKFLHDARQTDSFSVVLEAIHLLERVPCAFNAFRSKSLKPAWNLRTVEVTAARCPIWPVPPPLWRWTGSTFPNPRMRRRRRQHFARFKLLQDVVCFLNWIVLGYPTEPSDKAQAGEPWSADQYNVLEVLQDHIAHFCNLRPFSQDDLGRFGEKFSALRKSAQELPSHVDVDLEGLLHEIQHGLGHYQKFEKPHFAARADHDQQHESCSHIPSQLSMPLSLNKPVVADRIKWKHPARFNPKPYLLDPVVAAVFDNPDALRLPVADWPSKRKAKVQCSRQELLKLMKVWDAHDALTLFPCSEIDPHEAVGLFAVPKDQHFDRLIINPTVVNSRMASYSHYTKGLAPGALLSLLHLGPDESFRFCADDLSDFYYTFRVPRARAKRNCIGTKVFLSEVCHLNCFDPKLKGPFYPALATLAMGDSHAVEIAQGSHHALLQLEAGSMLSCETLEYRKPIPRGDFIELLAIDDHIGVQRVATADLPKNLPGRDTRVFDQANQAYSRVGLVSHPGKQKRFQTEGTILGADFDGKCGRVSANRPRVLLLMWITAVVCLKGTCTRQFLCSLLGCWIHIVLFRRPLLSLIDALFKEGFDRKPTEVFCLSNHAKHELISLCLLGPCAQADLRVSFAPKIYALDASPWAGGIVVADSNNHAVAELWRHSEQKGFYTHVLGPAGDTLKGLGLDSQEEQSLGLPPEQSFQSLSEKLDFRLPVSLDEGIIFDCVELFRGSGNWSTCHQQHGLVVHDGFEISGNRLYFRDLSENSTFREVIALALRKVVREWHAGPPSLTFSTLRHPRLRSKEKPWGFDPSESITAAHNLLARRTAMLGCIVVMSGAFFSCEQSGPSVMFRLHCFRVLIMLGCIVTRIASCNYGSAFNKPYQWLHNKGWLAKLDGVCQCKWKGRHFTIEGSFTNASVEEFDARCSPDACSVYGRKPRVGECVASFSAQYPKSLMHRMAQGSVNAKKEGNPCFSVESRLLSFRRTGMFAPDDFSSFELDSLDEVTAKRREWFEDPEWISELADSLPFRLLFKYHFRRPAHINVLESQVYSSWIKHCAKTHPSSRIIGLLDSRVTLGASAKGRSSSYCISRVLKQTIPYIIGSNLYPGGLHVYSDKNRADGPSRDGAISPATKDLPLWYLDLQRRDYRRFDVVCQSAQIEKLAARWLRLLLLLGGDIEPNPGPRYTERGELDLATGFARATADRMQKCLDAFDSWLTSELKLDLERISLRADSCSLALRAYGLHLYRSGLPRYLLVYAITAVQDRFPQHRAMLGAAWQVDKKWQQAEPGRCRAVISIPVLQAAISLALLWNWPRWAGITMIAFAGMLHPAEFVSLRRRDLMLPKDTGFATDALYVHLRFPKTARFARQQHVKISDPDVIRFAVEFFGNFGLDDKLFGATLHGYRGQWNAIMSRLGVPFMQEERGITPGSLRGSGATFLYLATEDIPMICWRGRWARMKTLEFYLQEVAAQVLLTSLPASVQSKIARLSSACPQLFDNFLHEVSIKLAAQNPKSGYV